MAKLIYRNLISNLPLIEKSKDRIGLDILASTRDIIITASQLTGRHIQHRDYACLNPMPYYNNQAPSFSEASDTQAQKLMQFAETNELPIVVMWSGGIDSTVILAAIIKHFPKILLNRVVVRMSSASYFDNPQFFEKYIRNKIAYTDIELYDYHNAIIVHGDPADQIWIQGHILNLHAVHPNAHRLDFRKNKDFLLKWLSDFTSYGKTQIEWLYDYVDSEVMPKNITLDTIEDFYWWINFSYNLNSQVFKNMNDNVSPLTADSLAYFNKNFFRWYSADEYQLWSIHTRSTGIKFDSTIRSYKMPGKEYIFDLDKDQRYKDYMTKSRSGYFLPQKIEAVFDDGSILLKSNQLITQYK